MRVSRIVFGLCVLSFIAAPPVAGLSDPQEDTIGWENGYWYNETLPQGTDQTAQLTQLTDRAIARVERVVGVEFTGTVSTQVQKRQDIPDGFGISHSAEHSAWNNQLWEALFLVGEDTNATTTLSDSITQQTRGYYVAEEDKLVIVTDNASTVPERTLIHELTHALQDDVYDITSPRYSPDTHTAQLGAQSIIEGHAVLTTRAFRAQCQLGQLSCQDGKEIDTDPTQNAALFRVVAFPYVFGPQYVSDETLSPAGEFATIESVSDEASGVAGVEENGTVAPVTVVPDTARLNEYGETGAERIGSPSVSVMFWNGAVDNQTRGVIRDSVYRRDAATGLISSRLVPYETGGNINGYVWKLRWTNKTGAEQFTNAYTRLLRTHNAQQTQQGHWRVRDESFADWFRVEQDNRTVVITNAPSQQRLSSLAAGGRTSSGWSRLGGLLTIMTIGGVLSAVWKATRRE